MKKVIAKLKRWLGKSEKPRHDVYGVTLVNESKNQSVYINVGGYGKNVVSGTFLRPHVPGGPIIYEPAFRLPTNDPVDARQVFENVCRNYDRDGYREHPPIPADAAA